MSEGHRTSEVASMILRINNVIAAGKSGGMGPPPRVQEDLRDLKLSKLDLHHFSQPFLKAFERRGYQPYF